MTPELQRAKMDAFFKNFTGDENRMIRRAANRSNGVKESTIQMMIRLQPLRASEPTALTDKQTDAVDGLGAQPLNGKQTE